MERHTATLAELVFFQLNSHTVVSEGHYPSFTVTDLRLTCSTDSIDTVQIIVSDSRGLWSGQWWEDRGR